MKHPRVPADARGAPEAGDLSPESSATRRARFLMLVALALAPWLVIASLIRLTLQFP